jgi:hypothetical protein
MTIGSYICTKRYDVMSKHSQATWAAKLLQQGGNIPKTCETRIVVLKSAIWFQLMNNKWI